MRKLNVLFLFSSLFVTTILLQPTVYAIQVYDPTNDLSISFKGAEGNAPSIYYTDIVDITEASVNAQDGNYVFEMSMVGAALPANPIFTEHPAQLPIGDLRYRWIFYDSDGLYLGRLFVRWTETFLRVRLYVCNIENEDLPIFPANNLCSGGVANVINPQFVVLPLTSLSVSGNSLTVTVAQETVTSLFPTVTHWRAVASAIPAGSGSGSSLGLTGLYIADRTEQAAFPSA